mgnify:CR=1 FL=1
MARIKRSRTGLSYFGKKVETQEIRFDKNVFVQKLSGFIIDGKQVSKTTLATRNNARELFSVNFFIISPTSNRTFKMPTENDIETILTAADGPQFETHQAYRFTIINTGSATVEAGDTFQVRMTSSSSQGTTVSCTVTVNNVSDTFSITTATTGSPPGPTPPPFGPPPGPGGGNQPE